MTFHPSVWRASEHSLLSYFLYYTKPQKYSPRPHEIRPLEMSTPGTEAKTDKETCARGSITSVACFGPLTAPSVSTAADSSSLYECCLRPRKRVRARFYLVAGRVIALDSFSSTHSNGFKPV